MKQPAVFGSTSQPAASSASRIEPGAEGSTRRIATVASSAPDARAAAVITSRLRKPPVPSTRRERELAAGDLERRCRRRPARRGAPRAPGPRRTGVLAHSPRGTTSPSSATATPRPPGSTPDSRTACATVAPCGQPARLAVDASPRSRGRLRGREALRARARPPRRAAARRRAARPPPRPSAAPAARRCASGPVAHTSPRRSPSPITGRLSGVPGRRPATARRSSSSSVSGITSQACSSRRWTPPAVTAVSKPCSSMVRAEHHAPVAAAHEVAARACARSGRAARRRRRGAQLEDLPLHRAHRQAPRRGERGRPRARRHHHALARDRAGGAAHAGHALAVVLDRA